MANRYPTSGIYLNFEVGDVFQYKYHDLYAGAGYVNDYTLKYTITTKTISGNTIEYETEGIEAGYFQYLYPPWDGYGYAYFVSYELEYYDSSNYSVNKFNNELLKMWNITVCPMGTGEIFTRYSVYTDSIDVPSKHFGLNIGEFEGNLYYTNDYLSDELITIPDPLMACDEGGFAGMTYKKTLGITEYYYQTWEDGYHYYLEGYIKNGDTIGIITPDSILLLLSVPDYDIGKLKMVNVYPNPADKTINFRFTELNNSAEEIFIEIRNLQGQFLMQQAGMKTETITLDVESLAPGIYLYTIKSYENIIRQGKLVIQ